MKCRYCGADLKENSKFCPKCGKMTAQGGSGPAGRPSPASPAPGSGQRPGQEEKPRKKGCLTAVIFFLIVALAGGAAGGLAYYKLVWQKDHKEAPARDEDSWAGGRSGEDERAKQDEDEDGEDEKDRNTADKTVRETMAESIPESGSGESQADQETTGAQSTDNETEPASEAAVVPQRDDTPHRYEIILKDCTWTEAFEEAKANGGYLVHIDSMEEYDYIRSNLLNTEASRKLKLWIGGARIAGSYEYHWANVDGTLGQEVLNSDAYPGVWMTGEPSFRDDSISQDEFYLNLFYYSKENRWVWNDVPNDIIAVVDSYKGSVGYICEYDQ